MTPRSSAQVIEVGSLYPLSMPPSLSAPASRSPRIVSLGLEAELHEKLTEVYHGLPLFICHYLEANDLLPDDIFSDSFVLSDSMEKRCLRELQHDSSWRKTYCERPLRQYLSLVHRVGEALL